MNKTHTTHQRAAWRKAGFWGSAIIAMGIAAAFSWRADAAKVVNVSPQGTVAQVRQMVVKFDEAMVAFGAPGAPSPGQLTCSDTQAVRGQGRWIDAKTWAYDFEHDLPPGVRCTLGLKEGLRSVAGAAVSGARDYQFETGGPAPLAVHPESNDYDYEQIEERQVFVVELNGPATPASVREHVWCEVAGLGNRIPVASASATARAALLVHFGWKKKADTARILTIECAQTLPAGGKMQLVYGAGVASPSGIANASEQRFSYTVREPFAASFSCERENAKAPCTPLRPLRLSFNAPIARADAQKIRLKSARQEFAPTFAADNQDQAITTIAFAAPLPALTELKITVPPALHDLSGRALTNTDLFPLTIRTAPLPPLAKFSSSTFGIIERFAEPGMPALVPVTLRHVEADLKITGLTTSAPRFSQLRLGQDAQIRDWMNTVERFDSGAMTAPTIEAAKPGLLARAPQWAYVPDDPGAPPRTGKNRYIDVRSLSLLAGEAGVQTLTLPKADPKILRPFEVIGVPLEKPGFYVLELASAALGHALLPQAAPMYVRTAVLVTNLGVHLKRGRDNSMVWVTTLDKGLPVPNAEVRVSDCNGDTVATGKTDAHGLFLIAGSLEATRNCGFKSRFDDYFVSARINDPRTGPDLAFVRSSWNRGIEAWRFNVPTDLSPRPTERAHTVFDRTLLRAGETVSMKHFVRTETLRGLAFPAHLPTRVTIRHLGSGQDYHLPLVWAADHSAASRFTLPVAAKLGEYSVSLDDGNGDNAPRMSMDSGGFRVEAFRLPVLKGSINARNDVKQPLIAAQTATLDVHIEYVSGGGAANLPVQVSALAQRATPAFADTFPDYSFAPPEPVAVAADDAAQENDDETTANASTEPKLITDKAALTLGHDGSGSLALKPLPAVDAPTRVSLEATFADPNGEMQTIRGDTMLWPAAVVTAIKAVQWAATGEAAPVQALVVDLQGKPRAGVAVEIRGAARVTTSSRKRLVGGFYAYDNHTETRDLGILCRGKSDAQGRVSCNVTLRDAGDIQLIASAKDGSGHISKAAASVWVARDEELWFGGENTDRIDILPEKPAYQPGETARFQVRMPFRQATALVAVERAGVIATQVVTLSGKRPTVELKVDKSWGPNVYVSVLALRGRLHEVPWYSFFSWGWKEPLAWARAFWREGRQYRAPTPFVDLSKPAFRYGLAEIKVGTAAHRLAVTVTPDAASYPVRARAHVKIRVVLPNGKPAPAGTQIAVAAVDEALLELMPNRSWGLLEGMLQRRAYGVETATAQMEIVGRRHFGRKAVPAGGGGGFAATRELFDTLLLWNPRVPLDANGTATLDVPLNDALTRFRIVAIAATGAEQFGTGSASIRSTQDLQLISGLPPLVREGDLFRAQFTLRNTTPRTMQVVVTPQAPALLLAPQTVTLAPESSVELAWPVTVPDGLADAPLPSLAWTIKAAEQDGAHAADALTITQRVAAALPVTVQQATLAQVDPTLSIPVAAPVSAVAAQNGAVRGGLVVSLQAKLANGLPGVYRWFKRYPYQCLEQQASRAVGMRDPAQWQAVIAKLPAYLDRDGLASYFPPASDSGQDGNPVLSSYLLMLASEAASIDRRFALPADVRAQLEAGLAGFIDGRIVRDTWAPRPDLDLRKLAAIEALSRSGAARARMLGSINITPNQWPTSALLDYHAILQRVQDIPQRAEKRAQTERILRARLTYQGTQLTFSTETMDQLWWLMTSPETNAARLALAFAGTPSWKEELPRLTTGLLALQRNGAWQTTTANALGTLAVERFSRIYESTPVNGQTKIKFGSVERTVSWLPAPAGAPPQQLLPWPSARSSSTALTLTQQGSGKPWATIESLAAVALKAPFAAGYRISKTITPVAAAVKGAYSRGDIIRVRLDIDAQTDMTWVAINDPIPAGATVLGSGLGRDSIVATQGEQQPGNMAPPTFIERDFDSYRAYYSYLPKGAVWIEYTMRLNNAGTFGLPPTRVEALYAPATYGAWPNPRMVIQPAAAPSSKPS